MGSALVVPSRTKNLWSERTATIEPRPRGRRQPRLPEVGDVARHCGLLDAPRYVEALFTQPELVAHQVTPVHGKRVWSAALFDSEPAEQLLRLETELTTRLVGQLQELG